MCVGMRKLLLGALCKECGDFLSCGQADDQAAPQHRVDLAIRESLSDKEARRSHQDPILAIFDRKDGRLQVGIVPLVCLLLQLDLRVPLTGHSNASLDLRPGGIRGLAMNLELHVLQLSDGDELI